MLIYKEKLYYSSYLFIIQGICQKNKIPFYKIKNKRLINITAEKNNNIEIAEELDARGLYCPEPLFETRNLSETLATGDCFKVLADDPAADEDLHRWAKRTDTEIVEFRKDGDDLVFIFKKTK